VAGTAVARHPVGRVTGALDASAVLVDPARGVLSGVVGWRPRLGDAADDLAALPQAVRAALG